MTALVETSPVHDYLKPTSLVSQSSLNLMIYKEQAQNENKLEIKKCVNSNFIDQLQFASCINDVVVLDCRLYHEFENNSIKNSYHIACRDRITKKRLSTSNKLSVKDLIPSDEIKKLLEKEPEIPEIKILIVVYDESTKDENDLCLNQNPLKIVLENIKNTLNNVNCKILEGGFMEFSKNYPQHCAKKIKRLNFLQVPHLLENSEEAFKYEMRNAKLSKILDYLYLGNESDSKNKELLIKEGITHVINCTQNIPLFHQNTFQYMRVAVNDSFDQDIKANFEKTANFIGIF